MNNAVSGRGPRKFGWVKMVGPILLAVVVSVFGTAAGIIAKHEGDVRTLYRHSERTNVDRYRRILNHYRAHYSEATVCVNRNKRIMRALSDDNPLKTIALNMSEQCQEDKEKWRGMVEHSVEDNKHMGYN